MQWLSRRVLWLMGYDYDRVIQESNAYNIDNNCDDSNDDTDDDDNFSDDDIMLDESDDCGAI